jgi:hypothetical protein
VFVKWIGGGIGADIRVLITLHAAGVIIPNWSCFHSLLTNMAVIIPSRLLNIGNISVALFVKLIP